MVDKLSGQVELIEVSSRRGRSATIAIGTITTGAAGTNASVTNVGTSGEAVFNFTIPMGDAVELRIDGGYLQWKNTTAATWTNILEIADITATIDIGTVVTGDPGTDVLVTNSGAGKDAVFNFAIPRGDSVELRIDSGYIQWKGTVDEVWNNLYAISAITPTITVGTVTTGNAGTNVAVMNSGTGKDGIFNFTIPRGDDVQLRISGGYFQWKNTTASTWNNIYAISDITATIEVGTVTTGGADSSVTFTNVGSGKDAIFNLSIPKGTTFTPSVSAEGVISFTNDGGLDNPTSVNIKGIQGDAAPNTIWQYSADNTTWTTSVPDGVRYMRESTDNGTTWSMAIELPTVAALDLKANITDVDDALALKADADEVTDALALKADATDVMNALESSVNGNIPIFDGVTGDKLKDSGVKLSDKADVDDMADALALKADITLLNQEKLLLTQEIDSLKKSAIENSNAPYLTASDYGAVALAKNSVGVGTFGVDGVTVENLITNGDFSVLSPWIVPANWEYVSASDNILTIKVKVLVSASNGMLYQNTDQSPIVGHKYFITLDTYAPFTNAVRIIYGGYDNSSNIIPTANAWKTSAFIFTAVSTNKTISFLCGTLTNYSINDEFKFRNIQLIDLTAHGLDSLTASQVGALVAAGYFDGKKTFGGVGCIKAVGKNLFDGELEIGHYSSTTGVPVNSTAIRNKNKYIPIRKGIPVEGSGYTGGNSFWYFVYDKDKKYIGVSSVFTSISGYENAEYVNFAYTFPSAAAINLDLMIQLEHGSTASPYIPYSESRQYFASDPMYSNATDADEITYHDSKYWHVHNVDSELATISVPYETEVDTNGQFLVLSKGTATYEPYFPDIGIYTDKFTLTKAITAVKELYKYGSATPITDAVIAEDGLSFTSASLASGDLAYGVFEFDEPLRPLLTIKSRNDDATIADTANGKVYTFRPVITNGAIASWTVTEV